MSWSDVGDWIKNNAGTGTALVGSLLTGNVPAAIAAGVSLVSSATGSNDPQIALGMLQSDPSTVVRLKELYYENEQSIRVHIQELTRLELEDKQKQHLTTQETIRAGDKAEDRLVRWTRPLQSWASLVAAFSYVYLNNAPDIMIVGAFLTLPWAYAGLRQVGKGFESFAKIKANKGNQ